jgi:hypothetical protein
MRLKAVMAELHMFGGDINWERPVRLGLSIDGRNFLRISVDRGETLLLDGEPLVEFDMGQYGSLVIRDFTDRLDATLTQGEIAAPRRILDGDRLIGLVFSRPDKGLLFLWASGDEFHWGDDARFKGEWFPEGVVPALGGSLW